MDLQCSITGQSFGISKLEQDFLKRLDMPLMPISPIERLRQLMATRNEWKLYHRTCDATGEKILSAYTPDSPYKVYKNEVWWGDSWEALDYGRDFDFSRPFFDQFYELQLAVPREGTSVFESQNCEYNSHTRYSKNCYLNSLVVRAEDMYYSYWMVDVENVIDCSLHIQGKSSLCYECIDFSTCYNCIGLQECYNCNDCLFSYELRGCDHCLFCSNLSKKSYHIANTPCSKEEFEKLRNELLSGSFKKFKEGTERFQEVRAKAIHRANEMINCENSSGDHIFNSKNCEDCFDGDGSEDCTNSISLNSSKDIQSCHSAGWPGCEQLYSCSVSRGCMDMAFCRYMWFCNDMLYSDSCQTCKHCIGCTGLRHKDYCILNKQYSKEEYEKLKARIIEHMKKTGEWGKFWPYQTLVYAYNESAAQDYFPLTREEALKRGFRWLDREEEAPTVKKTIAASKVPDNIKDIPDDVIDWAIECEVTGRPFKIIKQEFDFYRKMNLPLPRKHPSQRHKERMSLRNPIRMLARKCDNCGKGIRTPYAPNIEEKVFCEECYLSSVY